MAKYSGDCGTYGYGSECCDDGRYNVDCRWLSRYAHQRSRHSREEYRALKRDVMATALQCSVVFGQFIQETRSAFRSMTEISEYLDYDVKSRLSEIESETDDLAKIVNRTFDQFKNNISQDIDMAGLMTRFRSLCSNIQTIKWSVEGLGRHCATQRDNSISAAFQSGKSTLSIMSKTHVNGNQPGWLQAIGYGIAAMGAVATIGLAATSVSWHLTLNDVLEALEEVKKTEKRVLEETENFNKKKAQMAELMKARMAEMMEDSDDDSDSDSTY